LFFKLERNVIKAVLFSQASALGRLFYNQCRKQNWRRKKANCINQLTYVGQMRSNKDSHDENGKEVM
jgi:hypothetical protein